jgi:hypothetical protein
VAALKKALSDKQEAEIRDRLLHGFIAVAALKALRMGKRQKSGTISAAGPLTERRPHGHNSCDRPCAGKGWMNA